jgi:hypothetical protein
MKKMDVIRLILILLTIWLIKTARGNSYTYEDYDYISREAWLDGADDEDIERDHFQNGNTLREMFQLTERQDEMLVSERLFKTFCDMYMWQVLYNGEKK